MGRYSARLRAKTSLYRLAGGFLWVLLLVSAAVLLLSLLGFYEESGLLLAVAGLLDFIVIGLLLWLLYKYPGAAGRRARARYHALPMEERQALDLQPMPPPGAIGIRPKWFLYSDATFPQLLPYDDVLWAYALLTRPLGEAPVPLPAGEQSITVCRQLHPYCRLVLHTRQGERISIRTGKDTPLLLAALRENAPQAALGYTPELARRFTMERPTVG